MALQQHNAIGGADLHPFKGVSPTAIQIPDAADGIDIQSSLNGRIIHVDSTAPALPIVAFGEATADVAMRVYLNDADSDAMLFFEGGSTELMRIDTAANETGLRFADAFPIRFVEFTTDPPHQANIGSLYAKDVAGITELFWRDSDGAATGQVVQITNNGSVGGGGLPHSLSGDDNIIIEDSATNRAWLTADITSDQLVVGNATDTVNLIIESAGTTSPAYLQFGEASAQGIFITRTPTLSVGWGNNNIVIANSANIQASGNITMIGNASRADGIQCTGIGYSQRLAANDCNVGSNTDTGTGGSNNMFGNGHSCTGTGNQTTLIGTTLFNNGNAGCFVFGVNGGPDASQNDHVTFGTRNNRLDNYVFGAGAQNDDIGGTTTTIFRLSHKTTAANAAQTWRIDAGRSTGDSGSDIDFYLAESGQGLGSTQRTSGRAFTFAHASSQYVLTVGNGGATAANDAVLNLAGGDGVSTAVATFTMDGTTDDLTLSLPTNGQLLMTDNRQLLTRSSLNESVVDLVGEMLTSTLALMRMDLGTGAHTGLPNMLEIDYSGATSVSNASTFYGIRMTGITNGGGGDSVAILIDSGFDIGMQINSNVAFQASADLGFFGATPVGQPTVSGSRAGNAALADLLTELDTMGLINDTTTA